MHIPSNYRFRRKSKSFFSRVLLYPYDQHSEGEGGEDGGVESADEFGVVDNAGDKGEQKQSDKPALKDLLGIGNKVQKYLSKIFKKSVCLIN